MEVCTEEHKLWMELQGQKEVLEEVLFMVEEKKSLATLVKEIEPLFISAALDKKKE